MTGRSGKAERPRKRLYSIPEAGEYLGRTPWAIREMIWKGKFPATKTLWQNDAFDNPWLVRGTAPFRQQHHLERPLSQRRKVAADALD